MRTALRRHCGRFGRPVSIAKYGPVLTLRDTNNDRIFSAFRSVIVTQLCSETPCLTSHNRVSLWIVVGRTAEYRYTNGRLLQVVTMTAQSCLYQEIEKLDEPFGALYPGASSDSLEFGPHFGGGWSFACGPHHSHIRSILLCWSQVSCHVTVDARMNRAAL